MSALQQISADEVNRKKDQTSLFFNSNSNTSSTPNTSKNNERTQSFRKRSEDSMVSKILKPSLRMKAYRRQDTFHSLDIHVDHTQQTVFFLFLIKYFNLKKIF